MEKLNAKLLIQDVRQRMGQQNTRSLTMLYSGAVVVLSLLASVLSTLLSLGTGGSGGLSGLGSVAILETIQTILSQAVQIAMPFWAVGYLFVAIRWERGETPTRQDLFMGFRRAWPCLGILVNRALLVFAVVMITANISSLIYMLLPASQEVMDLAMASGGNPDVLAEMVMGMSRAENLALLKSMIPVLLIWVGLAGVLLIPLLYRFRLAEYVAVSNRQAGAFQSLLVSMSLMRRRCLDLFRLDLHFWWYYGLQAACGLLAYLNLFLDLLGIPSPFTGVVSSYVPYLLYLGLLFLLEVTCKPLVSMSYAAFYEDLEKAGPVPRKAKAQPENLPWDMT